MDKEEGSQEEEQQSEMSQEREHRLFSLEETRDKILKIESLFSGYLRSKSQQWESKVFREKVIDIVRSSHDIPTLARQLLIINEKFIYI